MREPAIISHPSALLSEREFRPAERADPELDCPRKKPPSAKTQPSGDP
jgi:hypothetical protein